MDTLNERIKNLRKEKGWTQLQLAEKLNVTDKAVSKWEVGEANPDLTLIATIASLFGVSIDYLLTGKKEEEKISLDDMDSEKRMHYLIKKDDADNFIKYGYLKSSNYGNRQSNSIYSGSPIRYGQSELKPLNISIWKEILDSNANKIFGKCCDSLLEETKNDISVAVLMTEILDAVIKKCVDLDRDDFLKALGTKYFRIGVNEGKRLGERVTFHLPIVYKNKYEKLETFAMNKDTLAYFFEKAADSPKAFKYLTELEIKTKNVQSQRGQYGIDREYYTCTSLYNAIMLNAIKVGNYELIFEYLKAFKEEVNAFEMQRDTYYIYSETFIYNEWSIFARFIHFSKEIIDALIAKGKIDLVKEIMAHNKLIVDKLRNLRSSYTKDTSSIYVITEAEIDRLASLNRADLTEDEKFKLQAVRNHIIVPSVLRSSRNQKLVREILDNNYYHYYEFVYDSLVKKNVKELFKFCVDNNLDNMASSLMMGESRYSYVLSQAWSIFSSAEGYAEYEKNKLIIEAQNKIGLELKANNRSRKNYYSYGNGNQEIPYMEIFTREFGDVSKYTGELGENPIIKRIKELKEAIYTDVINSIAAEKKAREDEIARDKVAKGLTKSYFEDLMSRGETELFMIKLCALQDAIFMYDYHYDGEDYSERLNAHFKELEDCAPKSRQCDDGWGYMVDDTEWENSEVIPAKNRINHLRDLFYRLRVSRNNISHPKKENVKELTNSELIECLEYVFSINRKMED